MTDINLVKKFKKSHEIKMSPNGKYIGHFSSSSVTLFDAEGGLQIADFKDIKYPSHITFSSNSKLLAVKGNTRKIAVYDLEKLELFRLFFIKKNSQPQDNDFCFTFDNKYILNLVYTNNLLGYISKINVETFQEEKFFDGSTCVFNYIQYIKSREQYLIIGFDRNISLNNGRYLAAVLNNTVKIYDYPSFRHICSIIIKITHMLSLSIMTNKY